MRLGHVGIWAVNLEEVEKFYRDILGFQEERSYEVSAENMEAIFGVNHSCQVKVYGMEDSRIELFDAPKGVKSGINHFAVSVEDRKSFCEEAASKGAKVIEVWRGDHPVYFVEGPSGVLIEIRE